MPDLVPYLGARSGFVFVRSDWVPHLGARSGPFFTFFGSRTGSVFGPKTGTWNPALINNISQTKIWTPKMDPDLVPKVGPTIDVFWSQI